MQKSSTIAVAVGLIAVALVAVILNLPDNNQAEVSKKAGVSTREAESAPARREGSSKGSSTAPLVELSPLEALEEEAPPFETIDLDDDGIAEIAPFISVFEQIQSPVAKIEMLDYARTVEPLDNPKLNKFLIQRAAFDDDQSVREAARFAMLEYSSQNGHASLEAFLNDAPEDIEDKEELETLLDELSLPSYKTLFQR